MLLILLSLIASSQLLVVYSFGIIAPNLVPHIRCHRSKQRSSLKFSTTCPTVLTDFNLIQDSLAIIGEKDTLIPVATDPRFKDVEGLLLRKNVVRFQTERYCSEHLSYLRVVTLTGSGYKVMNILGVPDSKYDLPIFCVDWVCMPGIL